MEEIPGHDAHFDPPDPEEGPQCNENPDHGPMEWDDFGMCWRCGLVMQGGRICDGERESAKDRIESDEADRWNDE